MMSSPPFQDKHNSQNLRSLSHRQLHNCCVHLTFALADSLTSDLNVIEQEYSNTLDRIDRLIFKMAEVDQPQIFSNVIQFPTPDSDI